MTKARQVLAKEGTKLVHIYIYIYVVVVLRQSTRTVIIRARALTSLGQPNTYSDKIKKHSCFRPASTGSQAHTSCFHWIANAA